MARTKQTFRRQSRVTNPVTQRQLQRQRQQQQPRPGVARSAQQPRRRRLRPGTRALREIRQYQKTTDLLIGKTAWRREVKRAESEQRGDERRWQSAALLALQEATEMYLVHWFEHLNLAALHAGRVTIQQKDVAYLENQMRNPIRIYIPQHRHRQNNFERPFYRDAERGRSDCYNDEFINGVRQRINDYRRRNAPGRYIRPLPTPSPPRQVSDAQNEVPMRIAYRHSAFR